MIYILAVVGAFLAGCINTLAGNGSAITLTILTELLGLPATVANATNRVGIFTQSMAGSWAFYRGGKLQLQNSGPVLLLTTLGALAGIYVATIVSNDQFRTIFRYLLLLMLGVILVRPSRWLREQPDHQAVPLYLTIPLFLALGFYGGFIQMGMGVFFLAITVLILRYDLISANAVKVAVAGIYTGIAVVIFAWQGLIDWQLGLLMAIGQTLGGYLTARFASQYPSANLWAYRLLVLVVVLALVSLFDLPAILGLSAES